MVDLRNPVRRRFTRVPRPALRVLVAAVLAASTTIVAPVAHVTPPEQALAAGTYASSFFREVTVFSGLTKPTSIRFASDQRAFVAEKGGVIKAFDSINDSTATVVADLSADVMNYWDRGLLGIAVDPDFLAGRPYLYVFYIWGGAFGTQQQRWGDSCPAAPDGPGGTTDGCVASTKVDRLTINTSTNQMTARTNLLWDMCQQFPSHSGGGLAFGPDKQLYVSTGEGASFNGLDYGQRGGTIPNYSDPYTPVNPCNDPVTVTSAPGTKPTVAVSSAQGGQLRSQDVRTTGDPTSLDGSLLRINPDTGAASSGNPLASSGSANARRIIAHGFRNPFRITFRPGTSDLYIAHVGNTTWEAINRLTVPGGSKTATTLPNAGWPCYEGPSVAASFKSLGTTMCANLYAQTGAWTKPFYSYSHASTLSPTGPCFTPNADGREGGAPTGLAFYQGASGGTASYPDKYKGGLFFVDNSRDCLAFFPAGTNGVPDATKMQEVASGIGNPVDLVTGPGGDLYYVDLDNGRVTRIKYLLSPVARATATPDQARAPVTIHLDGTASTDPDPGASLSGYAWDLDDDGQYDDATGATYDWSVTTPAVYTVGLKVTSTNTLTDTTSIVVDTTNDPPVPVIKTPSASLTWAVDDVISFEGSATDVDDGTLPGSALRWDIVMLHCPADCHEHVVVTQTGASGSFKAPDHDYPSHLELRLTATDSDGSSRTTSVALQPRTKTISVASAPTGVAVSVGGDPVTSPSTTTVFENATVSVTAPLTPTISGTRHRFWAWDDSTARVREVKATTNVSLKVTYYPDVADTCSTARVSASSSWISDRAGGSGDVDWYSFSIGATRRVVVTAGDLPVDAALDLYASCGDTRLTGSDHAGIRFEEITRKLTAGTYRVRVTFPGGGRSTSPYVVRFLPLRSGTVVKSARVTAGAGGGGTVRIAGEVINNTGATTGQATVTATFKDGSGKIVGTLTSTAFARRLAVGGVSPFVLTGSVPAYATSSFSVVTGSVPGAKSLELVTLNATTNQDGTVTETGTVRNTGTATVTGTGVARTWYGKRGEVLDRGVATVSPSTLSPGASGTFTVLRPALTGVQASRTQLRAS